MKGQWDHHPSYVHQYGQTLAQVGILAVVEETSGDQTSTFDRQTTLHTFDPRTGDFQQWAEDRYRPETIKRDQQGGVVVEPWQQGNYGEATHVSVYQPSREAVEGYGSKEPRGSRLAPQSHHLLLDEIADKQSVTAGVDLDLIQHSFGWGTHSLLSISSTDSHLHRVTVDAWTSPGSHSPREFTVTEVLDGQEVAQGSFSPDDVAAVGVRVGHAVMDMGEHVQASTDGLPFYEALDWFHTVDHGANGLSERVEWVREIQDHDWLLGTEEAQRAGVDQPWTDEQFNRLSEAIATLDERLEDQAYEKGIIGYHEHGNGVKEFGMARFLAEAGYDQSVEQILEQVAAGEAIEEDVSGPRVYTPDPSSYEYQAAQTPTHQPGSTGVDLH